MGARPRDAVPRHRVGRHHASQLLERGRSTCTRRHHRDRDLPGGGDRHKRVIHRDLKRKTMIHDGMSVLDFGLAKLAAREPAEVGPTTRRNSSNREGVVLARLQSMALEQAREPISIRARTFALGVPVRDAVRRRFLCRHHDGGHHRRRAASRAGRARASGAAGTGANR